MSLLDFGDVSLAPGIHLLASHSGAQDGVPMHEEWLSEIRFYANNLVMNVMVVRVVTRHQLQGVEGEAIATVVVNGLEGGECEEQSGLAGIHSCKQLCEEPAE